jgi:bifunctional oligoribonuclease and PAP phosphatase NrnA
MTIDGAAAFLREHDQYVIISHDGPDADGLGAAYALASTLIAIGKRAVPAVGGKLSDKYCYIDRRGLFANLASSAPGEGLPFPPGEAISIIVDTHDLDYLGAESAAVVGASTAVLMIDHHEPRRKAGELELLDSAASSSCELVFMIARALGVSLPLDAAEAVFAGIVYDTGSFAYPKTGERTFECALELVRLGVAPYEIHKRMFESSSDGSLLLQKAVIASLELRLQGRVAIQSLDRKTLSSTGASYEDAESLVNIPLQNRTVEVSVLFKENLEGRLRCSLRSKGAVNVARIAQAFGGGGHKTAAGFTCALPLAAAKDDVLQSIAATLQ